MLLKPVMSDFLFLCPHLTLAITVTVCKLEVKVGRVGGFFALNIDELLATEMMNEDS